MRIHGGARVMAECIDETLAPTFEDLKASICWLQGKLDSLIKQQQEVCLAAASLNQEICDTIKTPLTTMQENVIKDKLTQIAGSFADADKQASDMRVTLDSSPITGFLLDPTPAYCNFLMARKRQNGLEEAQKGTNEGDEI